MPYFYSLNSLKTNELQKQYSSNFKFSFFNQDGLWALTGEEILRCYVFCMEMAQLGVNRKKNKKL